MRPQDDVSGKQVFATFTKLFLNATFIVRNSSYSKLLSFFLSCRGCASGLATPRRAAPIPRQSSSPGLFFTLDAYKERQKVARMAGAALYSVAGVIKPRLNYPDESLIRGTTEFYVYNHAGG
jgi:hypothetical protein